MRNIWIFSVFSAPPEHEMRYRTSKMAQEFVKGGDKVTIFASSAIHNTETNLIDDKSTSYIVENFSGIDYVFVRCSSYKTNGADRIHSLIEFYFGLRRVIRHFDAPDCIIAESPYPTVPHSGIIAARKFNVPCITEIRDLWPESIVSYQGYSRKSPVIIALLMLEKWIYTHSSAVVFTMPGGWDYIKDRGWDKRIKRKNIFHINNGVDLESFDFNKRFEVYPDADLDNPAVFKVVYCGSIRTVNDLKLLVDAAKLLQERSEIPFHFILFGDGDQKPILEAYCVEQGISNVSFKGFVEKRFIPSIVTRADANFISVVASTLGRYGNSWNKLFEYLAAGKPVLSNCKNNYDLIETYNLGAVSPTQDSESIAQTVLNVAQQTPQEREEIGQRARKLSYEYDFPQLAQQLKDIIRVQYGSDDPVSLVSLCVIAYNEEASLHVLLTAIRSQDYPHEKIEIILVDSASTDATLAMMERFATEESSFKRVTVLNNPRRFLPNGWNVAIKGSSGDVLLRVDAHAVIPPDFVSKNIATLEAGEDVCGGFRPTALQRSTP
ncbi:MAG: glycosyltransferase, partial [Coriobacteriales bacterium]|nr:glycosyltransferase [Coriobacteriales bacterium]